ncbi:MAG: PHP domain-containing protein [Eubacteriales bacterium]|nr:PHP domain-containing protein [Christensenellaceae bacterium]MDY4709925.1 PHP domain-containing protein [Eubacteriales bacterium]
MRLNLHTHSNKSDGVFTPDEVVKIQADDKIDVMSLTDHDSVSGIDEAIGAGEKYGVKVLPGIELSCYSICEIHILGYNFDYKNPDFIQELKAIKDLRKLRISKTIERLHEIGVPLDASSVDFENGNVGRVHVAKEMVRQGIVKSVSDAFNQYIGSGKRAYVQGYRLSPMDAVKLIKKFGGTAVLAHPVFIPSAKVELLVSGLIPYGLDGLECRYGSFNETDTARFLKMADKYGLVATCGTDIHDKNTYVSPCYDPSATDAKCLKKLNLI